MAYILGVDVSHWQGRVNWKLAASQGIKFAMLKASEGDKYTDSEFERNYFGCKENGIEVGAYHFLLSTVSPVAQADHYSRVIENKTLERGYGFDIEEPFPGQPIIHSNFHPYTVEMSVRMTPRFGEYPVIYTRASFANMVLKAWSEWVKHRLWVANWTDGPQPIIPKVWLGQPWYIWQYRVSAEGPKYGMQSASVDLNRMQLVDGPTPEPPPPPTSDEAAYMELVFCNYPRGRVVTAGSLNIRRGPGTSHPIVGSLVTGTLVTFYGVSKDSEGNIWIKLSDNEWIAAIYTGDTYVKLLEN